MLLLLKIVIYESKKINHNAESKEELFNDKLASMMG